METTAINLLNIDQFGCKTVVCGEYRFSSGPVCFVTRTMSVFVWVLLVTNTGAWHDKNKTFEEKIQSHNVHWVSFANKKVFVKSVAFQHFHLFY